MSSPTQRTLARCRKQGWPVCVVEKYVSPFGRKFGHRVDAFGFGDLLALDGQPGALLIQACRSSDASTRVAKIRTQCTDAARAWLAAGNRIQVWGWVKRGRLWDVRVVHVTGDHLATSEIKRPRARRRRDALQLELTAGG